MPTISPSDLLLDTHVWLELSFEETARLAAGVVKEISASSEASRCAVSVVSLREIGLLARLGRIELGLPLASWVAEAVTRSRVRLLPLDRDVVLLSTTLPGTPHRDPWDQLLIATALHRGLRLVTRDREIAAYARDNGVKVLEAGTGSLVNEPRRRPRAGRER
jgi:PIN domain nuclease of toxin-antitoxin system